MWNRTTPVSGSTTPANQTTLNKIGDSGGQLTYNGSIIASGTNPTAVDRQTSNLYDKTRLITGTHHDTTNGSVVTGGMETHKINVKPGYTYIFNKSDGIATQYVFFDVNDIYITGASNTHAKAPTNASYMYVYIQSTSVSDVLMVMETNFMFLDYVPYTQKTISLQPVQGLYLSKWYEKSWWVLGDSISTGYGDGAGAGNQYATKPYHYVIARQRNIKVQNDAVSGYTINNIYTNKVVNMPPTANAPDLITIMAGTNDHGFNTVIGAITDDPATATSFYAIYRKSIEWLQNQYPYASIGLITPIQRQGTTVDGNVANAAGFTLRQYCDAVVAIAKYYSLQVLDWYTTVGFSPYIALQKTKYYCDTTDSTHPNDFGHAKMAALVGDFIEKL